MLNLEELKNELKIPIKSFRLFAIENILKEKAAPELLTLVEDCLKTEQDSECLLLLQHAASNLRTALIGRPEKNLALNEFEGLFGGADSEKQLELLAKIRVSSLKQSNSETLVPQLLKSAADEVVTAEIIKKFRRFWPDKLRKFLEDNAFAKSRCLQIAAIETLMKIYPETLKSQLHKLVYINDPVIRSLAIWNMSRFFPELAADFIADCLEKGDYYNKVTALKICSTLDFSLIKNSLLTLVLTESDPRLFNAACLIILNNPDKEIPFRLMDMISKSQPEKARFLNDFLPKYCENIKVAGICEDFAAFTKTLSDYAAALKARILVHRAVQQINSGSETEKNAAEAEIKAAIAKNQQIAEAAREYYANSKDSDGRTLLGKLVANAGQLPDEEEAAASLENEAALLKEFARARFHPGPETAAKAKEILGRQQTAPSLRLAAFKAATHLGIEGLLNLAHDFIASENEFEVSAGLEYLEKFDKDEFHRATQKLIHTESIFVRNALINSTSRSNPEYARFLIRALLKSRDAGKRMNALESTVQLDFSYIFPDLVNFLEAEDNKDLILACLSIFQANPRIDAIYHLQQIRTRRSSFQEMFEQAEKDLENILYKAGIANRKEISDFLEKKNKEEEARHKARYQAKDLVRARNNIAWTNTSTGLALISAYSLHLSVFIVIMALAGFGMFMWQRQEKHGRKKIAPKPAAARISRTAAKALETLPAPDTVKKISLLSFDPANKTWTVKDESQKSFRIFLKEPESYKPDERFEITVEAARYSLTGKVVLFVKDVKAIK